MKKVKCKSGIIGWEGYLKSVYDSKEEFLSYDEIYGIAARLGYENPEDCWKANPLIQGSTNPDDLKKTAPRKPNAYLERMYPPIKKK